MADLDTPSKRRVWILPIPDGAVGIQDRPHVGIGYSGIVISGAPSVIPCPYYSTLLAGGWH